MTQNSDQPIPAQQAAPMSEREMIEAAAAAAPVGDSTTTQKAMNIMEASVIQQKAVAEAFEAQKAAITGAVQEQRAMAMQQMAVAQKKYTAMTAQKKTQEAEDATKTLGMMTREAMGQAPAAANEATLPTDQNADNITAQDNTQSVPEAATTVTSTVPTPAPQATSAPADVPLPQTAVPHTEVPYTAPPQTAPSQPAAPPQAPQTQQAQPAPPQTAAPQATYQQTAPPAAAAQQSAAAPGVVYNPPAIAGVPVAQELAIVLRTIISEEVDLQLKALLAAHTGPENSDPGAAQ